jgi:hypothetical protein
MGQWRKVTSKSRRNGKRKALKTGKAYPPAQISARDAATIARAAVDVAAHEASK